MTQDPQKEITIFDYLAKVLPVIDVVTMVWIAFHSPSPWITTFIQLALPVFGIICLLVFKPKERLSFYLTGILMSIPLFAINCWSSETCPTWIHEFPFIVTGLLLTTNFVDRVMVIFFVLFTTILPMYLNNNSSFSIITIVLAEIVVWVLFERSVTFMDLQNQIIAQKNKEVEEKNKDIIDSINYAKRIQHSQLPTEKYIDKSLKRIQKD